MAESSSTITASGSSGTACGRTGPYKPSRHSTVIVFFQRGQAFTSDPVDGLSTSWALVNTSLAATQLSDPMGSL